MWLVWCALPATAKMQCPPTKAPETALKACVV
jgi:hypothetical protein